MVQELTEDGYALFPDGQKLGPVEAVIYCTGWVSLPWEGGSHSPGRAGLIALFILPGGHIASYETCQTDKHPFHGPSHRYLYTFPFLINNEAPVVDTIPSEASPVTVVDQRVGPLYLQVFPPRFSPSLSFIGLPWKVWGRWRGSLAPVCNTPSPHFPPTSGRPCPFLCKRYNPKSSLGHCLGG